MRDLINLIKPLFEAATVDVAQIEAFKSAIASKIKELPDDSSTAKALREIEDLLKHVHAGGKMGIINGKLKEIQDPTVDAAQKELARYILSMDMSVDDREELFSLWREDKLVKINQLLSPGKKDFSQIINKYNSNTAIMQLVNELMRIAALGQGKGEFGLSALSKSIAKQEGKGDLSIKGRPIEVKTTDGGAGRFTDQEVRPGAGFEQASRDLIAFMVEYGVKVSKGGPNLDGIVDFYEALGGEPAEAKKYLKLVEGVIKLVFSGEDVSPIMNAIKSMDLNTLKQEYAKTSFNYYMSKKKDEGVLYISLTKEPIMTVFFKDADELAQSGLRLHAGTAYPASVADVRLPYPQVEIVDTTFGANARAKAEKDAVKAQKSAEKAAKAAEKAAMVGQTRTQIRPPQAATPRATAQKGLGRERR